MITVRLIKHSFDDWILMNLTKISKERVKSAVIYLYNLKNKM